MSAFATLKEELSGASQVVAEPIVRQLTEDETEETPCWRVILFNDDVHSMDEVVFQIQKATGYSLEKAEAIMMDAHTNGQAIVYAGGLEKCEQVAGVLEQIGLGVTIECC